MIQKTEIRRRFTACRDVCAGTRARFEVWKKKCQHRLPHTMKRSIHTKKRPVWYQKETYVCSHARFEVWKKWCHKRLPRIKKRRIYTKKRPMWYQKETYVCFQAIWVQKKNGPKREVCIHKGDLIYQKGTYMRSHARFEVWNKMSKLNSAYQKEKYIHQKETCTFHKETNVDQKETNIYHRETYICSHARFEIRKKMSKETSTYPEERYIYHKETYIYHKETYIRSHCGLEVSQISPKKPIYINMSRETFIVPKRDPQKETVKRDRKK